MKASLFDRPLPVLALGILVLLVIGALILHRATEAPADAATHAALAKVDEAVARRRGAREVRDLGVLGAIEERAVEQAQETARHLAGADIEDTEDREAWLEERRALALEEARRRARVLGATMAGEETAAWTRERSALDAQIAAPIGDALSTHERTTWIVLAGLGLALLGLAAWVHRHKVARPLDRLADTMQGLARGEESRVAPVGTPELRRATEAFNQMVDLFQASRRDLQEQVDDKTRAVATALEEQRDLNQRLTEVLHDLESAQDRLVAQEKMAAVGTLAAGVAHEFNNVLGGIKGCTEGVIEDVEDPEAKESLEVVLRAAGRGRRIVDGLLRFSQSSTRPPVPVAPDSVVADVVRELEAEAREREVHIETVDGTELRVLADPTELHQVVHNLVRNALQAAPAGETVRIATAARNGRLEIRVSDRGPGIPQEIRSRIFEPFFTTREREGGTGLGLAISHGIVERLNGTLTAAPREGGGSEFVVDLPVAEEGETQRD